jgi:alkylation response protein AidB-like acyl-CoA dehydrogenase
MNFELNDIQQQLAATVREFGHKQSPVSRLRKMRKDPIGWTPATWQDMGELGWIMAPFSEDVGGLGGNIVDAGIILEQFGATLIPEPYATSVVAGMALIEAATETQREQYLTPLLSGDTTLALAWTERHTRYNHTNCRFQATKTDDGYTLSGEKTWVLNGHQAEHFIVSAQTDEGIGLFILPRETTGVSIETISSMDGHKAANITCNQVQVTAAQRLGSTPTDHSDALGKVLDIGAACAVAEGLGIAQTVLAMTIEYLNTREQFGAKIGSFQALQHRAVDMFVEVELLRSINMASMVKCTDPDPIERQKWVSAAKAHLTLGGRQICQESIQLHGGIGVTDEHDIGLYFKRMHVLNALYGDEAFHTQRFASLS